MHFTPLILGGYVNGYSIARTLYETYAVQSVVCDNVPQFSFYSSFCNGRLITAPANESAFINELVKVGESIREQGSLPVLFTTNDKWLIPVSKFKSKLEKVFYFPFSADWKIIERFIVKEQLYALCDELAIPYPRTFVCTIDNISHIFSLDHHAPYLVKPSNVVEYIDIFPKKKRNKVLSTLSEVHAYVEEAYRAGYTGKFILQEYIPGSVENLYTITTYSDNEGVLKGYSIGHKLTQYPEDAGTITSGKIKYIPEIIPPTKKILEALRFTGITNVEYKYDIRDGIYKMMEVNPRPGMWNYSSYKSGVNLFRMTIDDHLFNKEVPFVEGQDEWLWSLIDPALVLKKYVGTEEYRSIEMLITCNKVIDPRHNIDEGILYRSMYAYGLMKRNLTNFVKNIVRKGDGR